VSGAVQRMKSRGGQRGRIADVVEPRCSDQDVLLTGGQQDGADAASLCGDRLNMQLTSAERGKEALGVAVCPLRKRHALNDSGRAYARRPP